MPRTYPTRRTRSLAAALALSLVLDAVSLLGIPHTTEAPSAAAAFPGRSGLIVFASNRVTPGNPEGDYEIFAMASSGADVVQVTANAADDRDPAWSPDGTQIAFVSLRDGNFEIYTMNANGTNQTNRTGNAGHDVEPAWSPDGGQIAFRSNRTGTQQIFTMNANGNNQTNITNGGGDNFRPAWSPDGDQIAFVSNRQGSWHAIYSMAADGADQTLLTTDPISSDGPDWSPNGTKIAFNRQVDFQNDIFVMQADGSNPINITDNPANDFEPVWSPEGDQIAFTRSLGGQFEIFSMFAGGAGQGNRTNNGAIDESPNWQRLPAKGLADILRGPPKFTRGAPIAFSSNRVTAENPEGDFEIFTLAVGGIAGLAGTVTQLTSNDDELDIQPSWSPDGSKVAFVRIAGARRDIYSMNADGSNQTLLTDTPVEPESGPVWSPDGTRIAFSKLTDGFHSQIVVMQADGGNPTPITTGPAALDGDPDWSPDGSRIAFARGGAAPGQQFIRHHILTINPDGTGLAQLTDPADLPSIAPRWAPDGTKIAFVGVVGNYDDVVAGNEEYDLFIMAADGTNQRQLTSDAAANDLEPGWSPDGKSIVFERGPAPGNAGNTEVYTIKANRTSLANRTNNPASDVAPDWSAQASQGQGAAARADNDRRGAQAKDKPKNDKGKKDKKDKKGKEKQRGPHAGNRHGDGPRHDNRRHQGTADKDEQRGKGDNGEKAKRGHGRDHGGGKGRRR